MVWQKKPYKHMHLVMTIHIKDKNMSEVESKEVVEVVEDCCGNSEEVVELIYTNDTYRVEKIGLKIPDASTVYIYGVYHNEYNVLELETNILAKALNTADELQTAVDTFFQGKAFEVKSDSSVITS